MEYKKRHFVLMLVCNQCSKSSRLHKLDHDIMGYLHCSHCGEGNFRLKKQFVTEAHFKNMRGKERIILTETTKRRWQ